MLEFRLYFVLKRIWRVQILFLYSDLTGMFSYTGSMTTPGCDEVVTWLVMDTPIHIRDHGLVSKHNMMRD